MDLIDRLFQKINEEPLRPKVLLANSHAQGHQLLEQICKRYGAVFNVEIQTLRANVIANTKIELFRGQIRLLEEGQIFWIVRFLMKQLAEADPKCYITETLLKPGIVHKVHRAIKELRLAGICSDGVRSEAFTNPEKGRYLRQLLARYEMYLRENRQTDFVGLADYMRQKADGTIYLAIEPTGWSRAEYSMMEKIAGDRMQVLEPDAPFYINEHFATNKFSMLRATGSVAEIREGFRRMLMEPLALDRNEIILSSYEKDVPVLHAMAETLGIVCTYAGGLPLTYCDSGKLAVGILDWIEEGYPVHRLTALLRHGSLSMSEERWSNGDWARLLDKSGIGWGRERYFALLRPESLNEDDQEQGIVLIGHVAGWFEQLPATSEWHPIKLLAWLADFVSQYAPLRSADDAAVQSELRELAKLYSASPAESMTRTLAVRYVREMICSIPIRVSATPKPGAIHVSSLASGGWSGRDRTWIMGMDEHAWGTSAVQDPLMLDEERTALSVDLVTMNERARSKRLEREGRLSLHRGEVWLSYSSYDVGEQKGISPAFEMLQMLRIQGGNQALDFGALAKALGEPYCVIDIMHPEQIRNAIDANDEWMKLLLGMKGNRKSGLRALHNGYAGLAQGYRAAVQRQDEKLSAYDGWLDRASKSASDVRPTLSASQLERFAECGLKYYFSYVLKLRPREVADFDRTRWLQANQRGSLLHAVYQRYMEEITDGGAKPAGHSRTRLFAIVDAVIQHYALTIPAPSTHVFAKECDEIRRDAEVFYRTEIDKLEQPVYFELAFTAPDGEAMEIELPGGIRFKLKGFIDRIDRIGPHVYRIIDYKTGSPNKYKPSEYFSGGTQLQHALYAVAAEQWLRESGLDPVAEVVEADYYFPTERGRGEYVRRLQNRRGELSAVVTSMLEAIDRGLFVPANDTRTCRYCDYQAACGSHVELMKEKRESSANRDILSRLMEVECLG